MQIFKNIQIDEPVTSNIELRSEPVREIITQPPKWLVRSGSGVFFLIMIAILIASWFIHYPEIIRAPFVLTSANLPKSLNAKVEGKLTRLLVKEGQVVAKGDVLAFLESTARHEDVLALSAKLDTLQGQILHKKLLSKNDIDNYNPSYQLGGLQNAFQIFNTANQQYLAFLKGGFYEKKLKLLNKELSDLLVIANDLHMQRELYEQDYNISEETFKAQKKLFDEKVISKFDYNRQISILLAKRMPLHELKIAFMNNASSQIAKQKEILELEKTISEHESIFLQALNTFRSHLDEWKHNYLLVAPIAGKIHYSAFLQENQAVKADQEVFFISVNNEEEFGEVRIAQSNFGKVSTGQKVWIKFASYPSHEFGMVEGKVAFISEIPAKDNTFMAKVTLPKGLKTNYHKRLTYRVGMTATSEIITQDMRLIEMVFFNVRKVLQR